MQVARVLSAVAAVLAYFGETGAVGHVEREGLRWLSGAGYYPGSPQDVESLSEGEVAENLHRYLPDMKRFYGLGEDGNLDNDAIEVMNQRNCANKDGGRSVRRRKRNTGRSRSKRYSYLGNSFWNKGSTLTFGFEKFVTGLSEQDQIDVAKGCAKLWGDASSLSFRYVDPSKEVANILITQKHIDGQFQTVGYAQSPNIHQSPATSLLTLDNSETWRARQLSPGPSRATIYEEALCHEMGHTLGLSHSNERDAIMYQSVGNRPGNTKLHSDDIRGIQSLYGASGGQPPVGDPQEPTAPAVKTTEQAPVTEFPRTTAEPPASPPEPPTDPRHQPIETERPTQTWRSTRGQPTQTWPSADNGFDGRWGGRVSHRQSNRGFRFG